MKRRPLIIIVSLLVLLGLAVAFRFTSSSEPQYQGKGLSHWLRELDAVPMTAIRINGPEQVVKKLYDRSRQGAEAVQAIGTNALPQLQAILKEKDSLLVEKTKPHWQRFPWLIRLAPPVLIRQRQAIHGLHALGPLAAPAMPDLVRAMSEPNLRDYAVRALSVMGPPGMQALTNALADRNFRGRGMIVSVLGNLGPAAKPAVPALLICLRDRSGGLPTITAEALLKIGEDPTNVIPALVQDLYFKQTPRIQEAAAQALARIGPKAKSAVPDLLKLIATKSPASPAAADALLQIDAEAAARAGIK